MIPSARYAERFLILVITALFSSLVPAQQPREVSGVIPQLAVFNDEPESGALGAALQVLWTHQKGEAPDLTSDDIASDRVPLQEIVVQPTP